MYSCNIKVNYDESTGVTKVSLLLGEFNDYDAAYEKGKGLFDFIRSYMLLHNIPILITGHNNGIVDRPNVSYRNGYITEWGLENIERSIPALKGYEVFNETKGLSVIEIKNTDKVRFVAQDVDVELGNSFP